MANGRIFSDAERQAMTRKPDSLRTVAAVAVAAERAEALQAPTMPMVVLEQGTLRELDAECGFLHEVDPGVIEFLAYDEKAERVYLVNTEGSSYARYVGLLSVLVPAKRPVRA